MLIFWFQNFYKQVLDIYLLAGSNILRYIIIILILLYQNVAAKTLVFSNTLSLPLGIFRFYD